MLVALVVPHEHDGRQAEQVEQVDTNGEARHVENKNKPAVGMRLVGVVFPLQDEPEHHSGEGRGVGIDLALDGREPEGVAEGIDERTHHARRLNGNGLGGGQLVPTVNEQAAHQVGNRPEEEQNGTCREQGAHHVDHISHLTGVADQLREQVGRKHEEGGTGRVAYFEFITC